MNNKTINVMKTKLARIAQICSTNYATAYNGDSSNEPSSSRCVASDATYEVYVSSYRAWFYDFSDCAHSSGPYFKRGGADFKGADAGAFCSDNANGSAYSNVSFQMCLGGV